MKKILLGGLFILLASGIFAQSNDYRNQCRRIIDARQPVAEIAKINDATLQKLFYYALGLEAQSQNPLNETEEYLFMWLANSELEKRTRSANDFSIFLQEQKEANECYINSLEKIAVTVDSWIDIFRTNLVHNN